MAYHSIGLSEFKCTPFVIKGFAGSGQYAPILRDQKAIGVPLNRNQAMTHKHLVCVRNRLSYEVGPCLEKPGAKQITFSDPVGHHEAAYLPYIDNTISSIAFDNSVNRFFTDNLSGCSIFVDAKVGTIIAYHANVQDGLHKPTVEEAKDPVFEKGISIAMKTRYHVKAKLSYPGTVEVCSLFKSRYNDRNRGYARFAGLSDSRRGRVGATVDGFGTTVAGFRTGAGWEFWYQTWAYSGGITSVIKAECFGACSV